MVCAAESGSARFHDRGPRRDIAHAGAGGDQCGNGDAESDAADDSRDPRKAIAGDWAGDQSRCRRRMARKDVATDANIADLQRLCGLPIRGILPEVGPKGVSDPLPGELIEAMLPFAREWSGMVRPQT